MKIRDRLPRETRHFIPKFLAVAAIAENPGAFGITDIEFEPVLEYDEVTVPDATSLDVVAQAAGVPEDEIRVLNPHLPLQIVPAHIEAVLRLPAGTESRFERNYAAIPTEQRLTIVEHTISAGETLGHIARDLRRAAFRADGHQPRVAPALSADRAEGGGAQAAPRAGGGLAVRGLPMVRGRIRASGEGGEAPGRQGVLKARPG